MVEISVFRVLDKLEEAIRKSPRIPLTSIAFIDAEKILSLIERMRTSLPEELKHAKWVSKENQRILQEAQEKADSIIKSTEEEFMRKISESEIIKVAKEQAEEYSRRAKLEIQDMRNEANKYVHDIFLGLEKELCRIIEVLHKSREKLNGKIITDEKKPKTEDKKDTEKEIVVSGK